MDYRVELDVYNGPLDLLLYLIKRDELDIYDIPIARILDGYMEYLAMLKSLPEEHGLDINVAGEFLVMAATLMEIKSAMLLPKPAPEPGQESSLPAELTDPRYELVQQLLEYKRIKDAATMLQQRQQQQESRYPRFPARPEDLADEPPPLDLDEVQVWDLLATFERLMKEVGVRAPRFHEVIYDDTPIDLHAADIVDRLLREPRITLMQLLVGRAGRSEMIGVFLALLELIRQKKIIVNHVEHSDDFEIESRPGGPPAASEAAESATDSQPAPPAAVAAPSQPDPEPTA